MHIENPSEEEMTKIRTFIEAVKQDKISEEIRNDFTKFINEIPCKNIVLGCTEIPVLYALVKGGIHGKNVIDPLTCALNKFKKYVLEEK